MFKSAQFQLDYSFKIVNEHTPLIDIKKKLNEYNFVVVASGTYFVIYNYEYTLIDLGDDSTPIVEWLRHIKWLPSIVVSVEKEIPVSHNWRRPVLFMNHEGIVGVLTPEKRMEQLEEEKHLISAYFHTLAETINDSVTAVDQEGKVIYWNTTAEETYKIEKEEILGKKIGDHFSNESIILHKVLNEGLPVRGEYHQPNKDTHVLINASPIIMNNKISGGVATEHNITNILRLNEELDSNSTLLIQKTNPFAKLGSGSPKFREALKMAQKVAHADIPVHITGEPGSGKEMLAQAIHYGGTKSEGAFITLNCSVIPPALLEVELFGFQNAAFSSEQETVQIGRIEQAVDGTLFIEDIDKMPLPTQEKLLNYLVDHSFYRVGGEELVTAFTRIITSTSQSIDVLLSEGNFNEKLYYHLSVITIEIPPLRNRNEDIVSLVENSIQEFSAKYKKLVPEIHPDAMMQLVHYDWPGNVRELRITIERIILLNDQATINSEHLPENIRTKFIENPTIAKSSKMDAEETEQKSVEALEIEEALRKTYGNKSAAANLLGISRGTLYNKIKEYGIK